jgi:DNA-binding CsgD family transcriptional regulator
MARHGTFGGLAARPSGLVNHVRNRLTRVPVAVGGAAPMTVGRRRPALLGRRSERETLDRQLEVMRAGQSSVLILRGEPGIGKTALLEYLLARASGCRVARAAGVQSEMELAFAGLHQLCAPMLDRLDQLPRPQHDALATAFGLSAGTAPNQFLVGLAALSLLTEEADEQPLLCAIDDAQWLDRASTQALGFVARRLLAESVALVLATREPSEDFAGLPELVIDGLDDTDAHILLGSVIRGPLDEMVRERVVAEIRGNPLALLELPRALTPAELAGGFGLPRPAEISGRIEDSYSRRLVALPAETRLLLLVAAAEPTGDPRLVWRAAERLGIGAEAAAAGEEGGLIEFGARVRFRHPLVRSAVYRAASPSERQSIHGALAEATDADLDPDRRAWHRAQAAAGPDEAVAEELERSAGRARGRGGIAAAAAFMQRASELTPEPSQRRARALSAAEAKHEAGAPEAALGLLPIVEAGPLDDLQRARVAVLRGRIAFTLRRGSDAPPLLLEAARRLEPLDVALARETYLQAFTAALFAGRYAGGALQEVAGAARTAPPPSQPPRAVDLLLDGVALLTTDGYAEATPILRQALRAFRRRDLPADEGLRWLWLAGRIAIDVWDDESWYALSARQTKLARDAGALTVLPLGLHLHGGTHVYAGDFAGAESLGDEARDVSAAIGIPDVAISSLLLAAWRGRRANASEPIDAHARDAAARGEGRAIGGAAYASAVLFNGLARYELALAAALRAYEHPEEMWSTLVVGELVEAATRTGQAERAADALEWLAVAAPACGTDWALGMEARSRALVSENEAAESCYREAIDRLGRTLLRAELARAHLLYGEWLRRERRRVDAREQLRTAHEMLASMGAEGFAERAARELLATGGTARKRTVSTLDELTAQEARIARMAGDGASNQDIATQLFISRKTVEYHLHKVFVKLGISTRDDLAGALA